MSLRLAQAAVVAALDTHNGWGVDVPDVSGDTRCQADIEESQLSDERVVLQQEGELEEGSREPTKAGAERSAEPRSIRRQIPAQS